MTGLSSPFLILFILTALYIPTQAQAIMISPVEDGVLLDNLANKTRIDAVVQGFAIGNRSAGEQEIVSIPVYFPIEASNAQLFVSISNVERVRLAITVGDTTVAMVKSSRSGNVCIAQKISAVPTGDYTCSLQVVPKRDGPIAFQAVVRGTKVAGPSSFLYHYPHVSGTVRSCLAMIYADGELIMMRDLV